MPIKVVKLKSDEEIVCDFIAYDSFKMKNPLIINVHYDKGYIILVEKYLKHLKYDEVLELKYEDIQFIFEPTSELVLYYQKNIEKVKESDKNVSLLFSSLIQEQSEEDNHQHVLH